MVLDDFIHEHLLKVFFRTRGTSFTNLYHTNEYGSLNDFDSNLAAMLKSQCNSVMK